MEAFDLQRFVDAQSPGIRQILSELRAGDKTGHWMWFVFPQLRGLGHSAMAHRYGISSLAEAQAYLAHPVLGPRLIECTRLVNAVEGKTIEQIFPYPDDLKFRSSMTVFSLASPGENTEFSAALQKYFRGEPDQRTLHAAGVTRKAST